MSFARVTILSLENDPETTVAFQATAIVLKKTFAVQTFARLGFGLSGATQGTAYPGHHHLPQTAGPRGWDIQLDRLLILIMRVQAICQLCFSFHHDPTRRN